VGRATGDRRVARDRVRFRRRARDDRAGASLAVDGCERVRVEARRSRATHAQDGTMNRPHDGLSEPQLQQIATDAYVFLYPLVTMDITRRQAMQPLASAMDGGPGIPRFSHARTLARPDLQDVVRPNVDVLLSVAWLDLAKEPVILSVPDTHGRSYTLSLIDMWTDVFAVVGSRTTGNAAGQFVVTGPSFRGSPPPGIPRIDAPTSTVWILGRTHVHGATDCEAVHEIQAGYRLTPLSRWGMRAAEETVAEIAIETKTPPLQRVNGMSGADFFGYAADLLQRHPPHVADQPIVARMTRLGIVPGRPFDPEYAKPDVRRVLGLAPTLGQQTIRARLPVVSAVVNGWQTTGDPIGVYGTAYLRRALMAMVGLGASLPEDMLTLSSTRDHEGALLSGVHRYALHFEPSALPPIDACWSITVYDSEGFLVPNTLNRYAIGQNDDPRFNADGSLDLVLQHDSPGRGRESNWLPVPEEPFGLTMRLYSPRPAALDGRWHPPAVRIVRVPAVVQARGVAFR
jgi:hypothetical protein